MEKHYPLLIILFLALVFGCTTKQPRAQNSDQSKSLLIFTKTEGFRHASIPTGVKTIRSIASDLGIDVLHTENANYFHPDSLTGFDGVLFLNTTGDILNAGQQNAFQDFVHSGGGFMGIHSATDTEYEWSWYGKLAGAYFKSHPPVQKAKITVVNAEHPATSFLPKSYSHTDEWYNFKNISSHITVLLNLEESSYEGGANGEQHPIAWYHEFEGGRAFYTAMGHTNKSYSDTLFRKHLSGGLQYILQND